MYTYTHTHTLVVKLLVKFSSFPTDRSTRHPQSNRTVQLANANALDPTQYQSQSQYRPIKHITSHHMQPSRRVHSLNQVPT
jgi:hypothetical protein